MAIEPGGLGSFSRQSARDAGRQRVLELIGRGGRAFCTRSLSWTSPKAPRACLLESTSCRLTTWVERSPIFFCASSMRTSRSRRSVTIWPVAFSVRSSRSLDHLAQRLLLLAQRTLDPLHGLGLLAERQAELVAHLLGLAAAALAQQDDGQRHAQQHDDDEKDDRQKIHWQPL